MAEKDAKKELRDKILRTFSDLTTVTLISVAFIIIYEFVEPYDRGFYCNDETIRFPYLNDTVPLWAAALCGFLAGLAVIIMAEIYVNRQCCPAGDEFKMKNRRFLLNTLNGSLLFGLGAACTMLITEIGKRSIGRLRPHFISVCKPDWTKIDCFTEIDNVFVANYIHFNSTICTGDAHLIKEARLSFPSGHSSFTTYSMVFVIIYLEARMGRPRRCNFFKTSVQLIAFIIAWFTCMSRVSDFKHHHTDVLSGSVIGLIVALFVTLVTGKHIWNFQSNKKRCTSDELDSEDLEYMDRLRAI